MQSYNDVYQPQRIARMTYIDPVLTNRAVRQYLSDLIHNYQYESIDDLSQADQLNLISLILKATPTISNHEFFCECSDIDTTIDRFISFFQGDKEADDRLLDQLRKHAIIHYKKQMEELFNDVNNDLKLAKLTWLGYKIKQDPDNAYDIYRNQL